MGEHNRVEVQPQFVSELILSPLPKRRNKSIMSENVIELNKLNIFGETDLLHHPHPRISEPRTRSQTLFHGQFPLVFNRLCLSHSQPTGNPGIISLDFIISRSPNTTWINSIFWDRGLFSPYPGLKKKYTLRQVRGEGLLGILINLCLFVHVNSLWRLFLMINFHPPVLHIILQW